MIRKYAEIFCWKNVSSFCNAKATHIFSAKNIRILCIESAKTLNEMTLNDLVKLTTLWTNGPRNEKSDVPRADNSVKNWRNLPISNSKQIFTISMHIPSLVKIHRHSLMLSSGRENTKTDGRTHGWSTWNHNTRHYHVVGYKKRKKVVNLLMWLLKVRKFVN